MSESDGGSMFGRAAKKKAITLVDPAKLEELITSAPGLTPLQQEYLRERWLHQVIWCDMRSGHARRLYLLFRTIVIVGGIMVPLLASPAVMQDSVYMQYSASVVGVIVAACAAVETLNKWGEIWLEKRKAAEVLKTEGWLFLTGAGVYLDKKSQKEAFETFVVQIESEIAAEIGEYVGIVEKARLNSDGRPPR